MPEVHMKLEVSFSTVEQRSIMDRIHLFLLPDNKMEKRKSFILFN